MNIREMQIHISHVHILCVVYFQNIVQKWLFDMFLMIHIL
jgi:hypothetical protein